MITEAVLLIAGLAGTLGIGIPIANSLANPHRWKALWGAERAPRQERPRTESTPAYTPLDLGPDPTRWPSERAWPTNTTLREAQWPSRSWNDEHFGTHWRNSNADHVQDRGFHAMAARAPTAAERATPPRPPPSSRPAPAGAQRGPQEDGRATAARSPDEDAWFEGGEDRRATPRREPTVDEPKRRPAAPATQEQARRSAATGRQQQRATKPERSTAPQVATIPDPRPRSRAAGPPQRPELEHLISTVGLAGTVQAIMERTGWEFREAAHYLAKIRNGR